MAYKKLIKVSNVCQLLDKSKYPATTTNKGITWTNNGDGTITANGTTNEVYVSYFISIPQFKEVKNDHKYVLFSGINDINVSFVECICYLGRQDGSYFVKYCVETNIAGTFGFTIPQGEYPLWQRVELRIRRGYTANDLTFKPQLFDLTEMYGAGHEPTTVEQFRQDFPNEMYDYSPYCWLTSYKRVFMTGVGDYLASYQRNLTCKTKNLFDTNSYLQLTNSNIIINGNSIFCVATNKNASVSYKIPTVIGEKYTVSNKSFVRGGLVNVDYGLFLSDKLDRNGSPYLGNGLQSGQSFTLTASSDFLYIHCWVCYAFDSNNPSTLEINELQVNIGDKATDYVPYGYL